MLELAHLLAVAGIAHFLAGALMVVLCFRGLEIRPGIGLVLAGLIAGAVIYADLHIGQLLNGELIQLTWGRVQRLLMLSAAASAVGVVLTALWFRPERTDTTNERTATSRRASNQFND